MIEENKHIKFLKKIGFLIRYNDLELYHGRSQVSSEPWFVRNDIDNSCNVTRDNIMGIPCLCVANYDIAESYAKGTTLGGLSGKMKIHEIVSLHEDSLIVNEKFNVNKLSEKEALKFFQAIQHLTKGAIKNYLEFAKVPFEIFEQIRAHNGIELISESEEKSICDTLISNDNSITKSDIIKVIGAINSNLFFQKLPLFTIAGYVFDCGEKRDFVLSGGEKYRLNQDYVRTVLDANNIIAVNKKSLSSDRDYIVYVFNLDKVQTLEFLEKEEKEK